MGKGKMAIKSISLAAAVLVISSNVNAVGSGSNPKGKPFIAINDQIIEVEGAISSLQEQVDLLVGRVDSIGERVTANEGAIATLQSQNVTLNTLVQQSLSDIASIDTKILLLQGANTDLEAMIAANSGDILALRSDIDANDAMINTLQSAILMVQSDIISLESSLQLQIDNNMTLISAIQNELDSINSILAIKQNLINGACPDGSAIQEVQNDGSVICEGVAAQSGQLESIYVIQNTSEAMPGETVQVWNYCPSNEGWVATGAGYHTYNGWVVSSSYAQKHYGNLTAMNIDNRNHYLFSVLNILTCTRIKPPTQP